MQITDILSQANLYYAPVVLAVSLALVGVDTHTPDKLNDDDESRLIRAVKLLHSFSETCFPSNDFTLLARGTGSLDPCKEYHLAIVSLCHDAQKGSGSVKTR